MIPSGDWTKRFWQIDRPITYVTLGNIRFRVHVRVHGHIERYGRVDRGLRLPLVNPRQDSYYLLSSLSIRQTMELEGLEQTIPIERSIGDVGAVFYPQNDTWYIQDWRVNFPEPRIEPNRDTNLRELWLAFEDLIASRFPTKRILAPGHCYPYLDSEWQQFLLDLHYQSVSRTIFGKSIQ